MLYIASALDSTAVTHSVSIPDFNPNSLAPSLVVAKGNVIEVWDASPEGLIEVARTEVWGIVVGLEWVVKPDRRPHIVVLTDHPLSRLLMYRFHDGRLQLTASSTIARPSSRTAEFLTSLVADRENGLVYGSLYTGLLSVMEIGDWEPEIVTARRSVKGKRKESMTVAATAAQEDQSRPNVQDAQMQGALVFKEQYEVTISEHNLLSLAVFPYTTSSVFSQALALLYLTPDYTVNLVARTLDRTERSFVDLCSPVDVLSATYNHREFSVPAAKRLLTMDDGVVVIGDEFCAKYTLGVGRSRSASQSSMGGAPSASLRMSPDQTKRRKNSQGAISGSGVTPFPGSETSATASLSWQKSWRVRQGFGDITGTTALSAGPSAIALLGDSYGRTTLISSAPGSRKAIVQLLSTATSPASCISHIDGLVFFIGSQTGDSQVVQLQLGGTSSSALTGKSGKGKGKEVEMMQIDEDEEVVSGGATGTASGLEILSSWNNLGPIRDFCLVEDREGGSHLMTASGANSSGSLRIVRSGVGTEELLRVEGVDGVQRMFPADLEDFGTILVLSTAAGSTAVRLTVGASGDIDVQEIAPQWQGFNQDESTLVAVKIRSKSIVQVTPSRVVVSNIETGRIDVQWSARDTEILCADVTASGVVLALRGGAVAYLTLSENASGVIEASESVTPLNAGEISAIAAHGDGQVVAVAFWGSNSVNLYSVPQMSLLRHISTEQSLPRSLRIKSAKDGRIQILVGRGDGRMVIHSVQSEEGGKVDTRESVLGTRPVELSRLFDGGSELGAGATLALTDKVSLVYEENGRTSYSALAGKDTASAALGRLAGHGDCVFTATQNALSIQSIQSVKKLHIRKVEMGGFDPIAIAHDARSGVFGVAISRTVIDQQYGDEYTEGAFRLYDGAAMTVCAELTLDQGESPTIIESVVLDSKPFFCLGSVYTDEPDDSGAASRGKLRIIEVVADKDMQPSIHVVVAHDTKGPVLDCKAVWNRLAICVDHQVELLALNKSTLNSVSTWGSCFIASCLSVQQYLDNFANVSERLHVGDGMRSVFALELVGDKDLTDVGRDMKPHWVVSMEELHADNGAVVLADTSYNVLTIRHDDNKLENAAALALHETVTKFKRGMLVPDAVDPAIARPEVIFATSSGRVGIIADLYDPKVSNTLNELQRNLDSVVTGPAMDWRKYREIHTEGSARPRPTVGFVDGDFIKTFLDRSTDIEWATSVINGTSEFSRIGVADGGQPATLEDVVKVVEVVSRMH